MLRNGMVSLWGWRRFIVFKFWGITTSKWMIGAWRTQDDFKINDRPSRLRAQVEKRYPYEMERFG